MLPKLKKEPETEPQEEYAEILSEPEVETKKTNVIIDKLELVNVDKLLRNVKDGSIVIVKIKELKEANIQELKYAINKMRNICENIGGDIAGVGDEWLILTPNTAKIER